MRELILFRHAKAEASATGGDRARALTISGRETAVAMGAKLAAEGVVPDLALVSDAVRTIETWSLAQAAFPEARVETLDALYEATSAQIAATVRAAASRAEVVIVVGHNPGLQAYAVECLSRGGASVRAIGRIAASFTPAMAVVLAIDAEGRASLDGLYDPRDLDIEP